MISPRAIKIVAGILVMSAIVFGVYRRHANQIADLISTTETRVRAEVKTEIEAQTAVVETESVEISTDIRSKADEKNNATVVRADDVRVRGPGKAGADQCGPVAGNSSGGHQPASGTADAAVAAVPDQGRSDLIVVPFADLVSFAEAHDLNITEVLAWRENQLKQTELLAKVNQ